MAEPASSGDLLERYGAIEKAYCDEHWDCVIQDGQTLLETLARGAETPDGLKERLQLLMAHAHLYGFGDRDSAEDLYQAVLRSGGEASLRQIAEQGLQQCAQPLAAPTTVAVESPPEQQRLTSPESAVSEAAEPFSPLASIAVEPVAVPAEELSWLQQASSEETPSTQTSPVMPWLSATPPAASADTQVIAASAAPSQLVDAGSGSLGMADLQAERAQPLDTLESLVPEVVEEPELIEVHQADPLRAEELEVSVRESLPPAFSEAPEEQLAVAEIELPEEQLTGVSVTELTPVAEISGLSAAAVLEAPPPAETLTAADGPAPALHTAPTLGRGPFSGPPEAVTEEDPELLLGLLRVEMG